MATGRFAGAVGGDMFPALSLSVASGFKDGAGFGEGGGDIGEARSWDAPLESLASCGNGMSASTREVSTRLGISAFEGGAASFCITARPNSSLPAADAVEVVGT